MTAESGDETMAGEDLFNDELAVVDAEVAAA